METPSQTPLRIVSGGQTGVDRAALDAALAAGVPCGGWCPAGRRAEDGPIPLRYPLRETPTADYAERTRRNVRDSDATLVLAGAPLVGGTAYTVAVAEALGRPVLVLDPGGDGVLDRALGWLAAHRVTALNVAGPREREEPGVYDRAFAFVSRLIAALSRPAPGA